MRPSPVGSQFSKIQRAQGPLRLLSKLGFAIFTLHQSYGWTVHYESIIRGAFYSHKPVFVHCNNTLPRLSSSTGLSGSGQRTASGTDCRSPFE